MSSRLVLRSAAVVAALGTATTLALAGASPASAATRLELDYHAAGSTTLVNPNSGVTVTFAPTKLQSFVTFNPDNTGSVKAYLPLAPVTASFKAYGFLPARGTVVFTQVGAASGTLGQYNGTNFPLSVTARYVVSLRDVVIGGAKANVGDNCQSVRVVNATVTSDDFSLSAGTLTGTYDLSNFNNCGAAQTIINDTLPGKGNTLSLSIDLNNDPASTSAAAAVRSQAIAAR